MKILNCAIHNIKKLKTQHLTMFLLISISTIISTFGILFYTGYIVNYYSDEENVKCLSVEIDKNADKDAIYDFASELRCLRGLNNIVLLEDDYIEYYTADEIPVIGEYSISFSDDLLIGKAYNFDSTKNNALITEYTTANLQIKGNPINYSVKNNELYICGVLKFNKYEGYIVPVNYFIENYKTKIVNADFTVLDNSILDNEINLLISKYQSIITNSTFSMENSIFDNENFISTFVQILLIFCIAIINIFAMIAFWLKSLNKDFKIYLICGLNKKSLIAIIMVQSVLLFTANELVGLLLYLLCLNIFAYLGIVINGFISIYLLAFLVVFLISVIGSFIVSLRIARQHKIYILKD